MKFITNILNPDELIKEAIERTKQHSFTQGSEVTEAEVVGVMISKYFRWSGDDIFTASFSAFEDSNFHTFNEKFNKLWEEGNE